MKRVLVAAFLVAGIMVVPVVAGEGHACCKKAEAKNGWCKNCSVGFAFGVPIQMAKLHGALIGIPAGDKCPGCTKAAKDNGTCTHCKVAFAGGHAFKSPYARSIALGEKLDAEKITCKGCAKGADGGTHGWCDDCKVGIVSGYAFKDKADYEKAVGALTVIKNASEAKCEPCAVGMVTDGTCQHCKVSYQNGKVSQT